MSFGPSNHPQQQAFTGQPGDAQSQAGFSPYGAQMGYIPQNAQTGASQPAWPAGGYAASGTQPLWGSQPAAGTQVGSGAVYGGYTQGAGPNPTGGTPAYASGTGAYGTGPVYPGNPAGGYGAGYGVPGAGQPAAPYAQTGYASQPGYVSQTGYGNQQGYGAPGTQNGSYIPQTPYSQGYASPGYTGTQTGMGQGYEGYGQMGRNPQARPAQPDPRSGIPLNGSGYVPPRTPARRLPFEFNDGMLILLSAVLIALFAVGLTAVPVLLWVFLILGVASAAFFWIRPVIATNKRLCFTVIMGALAVVALLRVTNVIGGPSAPAGSGGTAPGAAQTVPADGNAGTGLFTPSAGFPAEATPIPEEAETAEAQPEDNAAARVESFFYYWMVNKTDDMLALCSPTWQRTSKNPKADLFGLIANRTPLDAVVEKTSGTPDDTSRTVTVSATIDRNNGKDPVKYRLGVLVMKEEGDWYIDPQSLKSYDKEATQDPKSLPTATPTAVPPATPGTVLYYNPKGGSKYHLDQNCKSLHAKYLPMQGHFTYAEINDEKYRNLEPCNVCAAPLRQ